MCGHRDNYNSLQSGQIPCLSDSNKVWSDQHIDGVAISIPLCFIGHFHQLAHLLHFVLENFILVECKVCHGQVT